MKTLLKSTRKTAAVSSAPPKALTSSFSPSLCAAAFFVAIALPAVALFSSCSSGQKMSAVVQPSANRKAAPDFSLKDASGAAVKLSDYHGKVVLLNFWATWCGPCGLEIPWFKEFEQQYKSKGFAVLGVSMDDDGWSAVKPYIADHKMNYRVLLGNDSVAQLYGGLDALPTTYIIDRDGKMAFPAHVGLINKSEYVQELESLLGREQQTFNAKPAAPPAAFGLFGSAR